MRRRRNVWAIIAAATLFAGSPLLPLVRPAGAAPIESAPVSDRLDLGGSAAYTWSDGATSVVQLDGPVVIRMEGLELRADRAVVWLSPVPGRILGEREAKISLLGNTRVRQGEVTVERPSNYVNAVVRGNIRITSETRLARDLSGTGTYKDAYALRPDSLLPPPLVAATPRLPSTGPGAGPTTGALAPEEVGGAALTPARATTIIDTAGGRVESVPTADGRTAVIISSAAGPVRVLRRDEKGNFLELSAQRMVLYTRFKSLTPSELQQRAVGEPEAITAAYMEGDVRMTLTPRNPTIYAAPPGTPGAQNARFRSGEIRLSANRVFYELDTDRAVLTDAVMHTVEPLKQIPVIVRANTMRQLAQGEYSMRDARLSTSAMATPSYSVGASKLYVREIQPADPSEPRAINFQGENVTFQAHDTPFFYLPYVGGTMTENGFPLRQAGFEKTSRFGTAVTSQWGLFETLGKVPPRDLDAAFRLDYFDIRGPAIGLDAKYRGGFVTEETRDPWNFEGDFESYAIFDAGEDLLGGERGGVHGDNTFSERIEPEKYFRYHLLWEHQHFFPGDWQVQLRAGIVSDPTFQESWFRDEFHHDVPYDVSAYFKRQRDTEALTLLTNFNPTDHISTEDLAQEQFEVEKIPEIGYRRIGDSFGGDRFTFFSQNTASRVRFNRFEDDLDTALFDEGYRPEFGVSPGIPSLGQTGVRSSPVYRADFREEVDYPFTAGQFKVVPYVVGRYTPYSDSPSEGTINRIFTAAGTRINTAFWKVDDTAQSELFDIHRVRHVIEPGVNLFTSGQTYDRNDVFIYEEPVDDIHDFSGGSFSVLQRWQTKRGGPGHWHNVDFLTLNVEANYFANRPSDRELSPPQAGEDLAFPNTPYLKANDFRGVFFDSVPEASVPRDSVNADARWLITDQTILLSDMYWNADAGRLATASAGLAVQRDERTTYFLGIRHIDPLHSNIGSFAISYKLTTKYTVGFSQSYDFTQVNNSAVSDVSITRYFDRWFATFEVYTDDYNNDSGFRISVLPTGFTPRGPTGITNAFGKAQ